MHLRSTCSAGHIPGIPTFSLPGNEQVVEVGDDLLGVKIWVLEHWPMMQKIG